MIMRFRLLMYGNRKSHAHSQVSPQGRLTASGQLGSDKKMSAEAPVVVGSLSHRTLLMSLNGLAGAVNSLSFSHDGKFLAGAGSNCMLIVWDCETGETVYTRRTESVCAYVKFSPIGTGNREYQFLTIFESTISIHSMKFNLNSMNYSIETETMKNSINHFGHSYHEM